mgnify:CR=1 FL=1
MKSLLIRRGAPPLPDEETERQMYERTKEILHGYGYERYEISNYAKEGKMCRHNIGYWKRVPYLGFGVGAASLWKESDGATFETGGSMWRFGKNISRGKRPG